MSQINPASFQEDPSLLHCGLAPPQLQPSISIPIIPTEEEHTDGVEKSGDCDDELNPNPTPSHSARVWITAKNPIYGYVEGCRQGPDDFHEIYSSANIPDLVTRLHRRPTANHAPSTPDQQCGGNTVLHPPYFRYYLPCNFLCV